MILFGLENFFIFQKTISNSYFYFLKIGIIKKVKVLLKKIKICKKYYNASFLFF